ncbi:MAG: hypothetical protein GQ552_09165 [Flavobacteriaceae bacterium]|nr:hypothetical protein [Flavobacteriaceae bacterium]
MKNLRIKLTSILLLALIFTSCKENVNTEKQAIEETVQTEVKTERNNKNSDKTEVMLHATSQPNYMNFILKNKETLNIDKEQYQKLEEIKKVNSPKAVETAYSIKKIEEKIYQLSLDNIEKESLLNNLEETLELRTSLADTKLDCRNKVLEILNEEQWNELLKMYKEKMPFDNKTEMTSLIKHVNPLPNYMQLIKNKDVKLDKEQEEKLTEWSNQNHPGMMKLAAKVNTLEKEVYELSMNKETSKNILKKVNEIADVKKQIVITKTDCRDNLKNNILSKGQWEVLSSK